MPLLRQVVSDAVQLARSMRDEKGPPMDGTADATWAALTQDGYTVLFLTRLREAARRWRVPLLNHLLRRMTVALYGIEIGNAVTLGEGVNFTHTVGIVIGGTAAVGARVRFMGNNTVGTAKENGCPVIEDDVVVGCGARVLGPIRVGAGAVIGANAVVLHDVPAGAVVTGAPARPRPAGATAMTWSTLHDAPRA